MAWRLRSPRLIMAKSCAARQVAVLSTFFLGCTGNSAAGAEIWTDQDQAIEITWSSVWLGSYKLKRERTQLTAEQRRLLGAIRTSKVTNGCLTDGASAELVVTDSQAKTHHYVAADPDCERSQVGYADVEAFLSTADCALPQYGPDADLLARAPHVDVGDGCWHGIYSSGSQPSGYWFLVDVATPGLLRFAIQDCLDRQLRLGLFDAAGAVMLQSTEFTDSSCPLLEFESAEPNTFALHLELLGGTAEGDFYLTVDRLR
jgi:hypothetical protein